MNAEQRTGFLPALGAALGCGVYGAEHHVVRTRNFDLMEAGAHGRNRRWTVDDLAAIALAVLVFELGRPGRRVAARRIRDDAAWRGAVLADIRHALCFGGEIVFELPAQQGPVAVTLTMPAATVGKLAALVDDWRDLRAAREDREAA